MAAPHQETAKRPQDAELAAMGRIWRLIDELDEPAAGRVLAWLNKRYEEKRGPQEGESNGR